MVSSSLELITPPIQRLNRSCLNFRLNCHKQNNTPHLRVAALFLTLTKKCLKFFTQPFFQSSRFRAPSTQTKKNCRSVSIMLHSPACLVFATVIGVEICATSKNSATRFDPLPQQPHLQTNQSLSCCFPNFQNSSLTLVASLV